ncbi:hypothetical protein EIP91_010263 [Steccherinum ochraceum]|uniref:Cytochrome P450 n=1 Tax=Steccherinum ochraceum TaxID=92696 RepID=A0A4R0R0T6_9APHY|nr:hypothetical protein EIP91_010263 [Steccherinum ochraceum]
MTVSTPFLVKQAHECSPWVVSATLLTRKSRGPLPPGPPGIPILGNILPVKDPWETIRQYSLQYGPLVRLRVLTHDIVTVNTLETATELFDKRAAIYSARDSIKMAVMAGIDNGVTFEPDPARQRLARRLVATGVGPVEITKYKGRLREHVTKFLGHLLRTPDKFLDHIRDFPIAVMLDMVYGYESVSGNDAFVLNAAEHAETFSRATVMSEFLVNWIPLLEYVPSWVPGAGFKKIAARWKKLSLRFREEALQYVSRSMANGTARPSVISKALESSDYPRDMVGNVGTQLVSGGADTNIGTISTFILLMVLHPEIQKRAQAEIDAVMGPDALPEYADRSRLPFVQAMIRETFRYRPPAPMTDLNWRHEATRNTTQDDIYEGQFIPKGMNLLINLWAILYNEEIFPEPNAFKPDRWLLNPGLTAQCDPLDIVFGFGRRECSGKNLAQEMVFTAISNILALFDISKAQDHNGNVITPAAEFTSGSITAPLPFKCSIKPRSQRTRQHLENILLALGQDHARS